MLVNPDSSIEPKSVLMCRPSSYDLQYAINPWMLGQQVDTALASIQFDALVDCYERLGFHVDVIEQDPKLPDMVFTANAGLILGNLFIPSNFRYPERAPEADTFAGHFQQLGWRVERLADRLTFEGAGDALSCGDDLYLGYGFRSKMSVRDALSQYLDASSIISLGLSNPYFYHLDTCFSPLPSGRFIYYPDAFEDRTRKILEARHGYWVTERFCMGYGCNMVAIGDALITSYLDDRILEVARIEGLKPIQMDMSEFIKAGGGVRCLSFFY